MVYARRLPLVLGAALLTAACASSPSPEAQRSTAPSPPAPGPSTYVALGDSVAAGVGAARPDAEGYVPLLAGLLREELGCDDGPAPGCPLALQNLAQSGATTATLRSSQLPRALELLRSAPGIRLVTVTIGGNDVFEPVVRACAAAPRSPGCRQQVVATLARADEGIDEVLRALTAAAGPGTTIAVMAYYDPLPACRLAPLQELSGRVLEGDGDQPGLNDALRARAAQHGAVVVETRDQLAAPGSFVGDTDCLHPSGRGHARIAQAFLDVVGEAVTG